MMLRNRFNVGMIFGYCKGDARGATPSLIALWTMHAYYKIKNYIPTTPNPRRGAFCAPPSGVQIPQPGEKAPTLEKMTGTFDEMVPTSKKMTGSFEKIGPTLKKMTGSFEEIVPTSKKMTGTFDEIVPASKKMTGSFEEIVPT